MRSSERQTCIYAVQITGLRCLKIHAFPVSVVYDTTASLAHTAENDTRLLYLAEYCRSWCVSVSDLNQPTKLTFYLLANVHCLLYLVSGQAAIDKEYFS